MTWGLFGARPLPKPVLTYWWLGIKEQISGNLDQITTISLDENQSEIASAKWRPLHSGLDVLKCNTLPQITLIFFFWNFYNVIQIGIDATHAMWVFKNFTAIQNN